MSEFWRPVEFSETCPGSLMDGGCSGSLMDGGWAPTSFPAEHIYSLTNLDPPFGQIP